MKKIIAIIVALLIACVAFAEAGKIVAKDGADMQTQDPAMPTRVPMEGGTKILMHFGDTVIPVTLNDSITAQALVEKLPFTQHESRYSHDFCGVTEDLPYDEGEVHYGWLNGDLDYAIDAPYLTLLFEDEEESEIYGDQVNIGVMTCPLEVIRSLDGSYDVLIELAPEEEEENAMNIIITDGEHEVEFALNNSSAAWSLYAQLPLTIQTEDYGGNEKIFYPEKLDTSDVPMSQGQIGDLAYFAPWGDVVLYYDNAGPYSGLYDLGRAVSGADQIKHLSGTITITAG